MVETTATYGFPISGERRFIVGHALDPIALENKDRMAYLKARLWQKMGDLLADVVDLGRPYITIFHMEEPDSQSIDWYGGPRPEITLTVRLIPAEGNRD